MSDQVDRIIEQWHAEKPGFDVSPMAIIGRLSRTTLVVESRLAKTFARHGLDASSFDVLATLLRSGAPYRIAPLDLAREAMISTSAVAQRLNKLEGRGLVTREANYRAVARSKLRPDPAPITWMIEAHSALPSMSETDAFCTLRILPRIGSSA